MKFGKGSATKARLSDPVWTRPLLNDQSAASNAWVSVLDKVAVGNGRLVEVVKEYREATVEAAMNGFVVVVRGGPRVTVEAETR